MKQKTYVIRKIAYLFNDEYYFSAGLGGISGIYHDEEEAKQEYVALEVAEIRQLDFGKTKQSFSNQPEERRRLHEYLQTMLPQSFFWVSTSGEIGLMEQDSYLPASLTDEQIMEIREVFKFQFHELSVFEDEAVFYATWLPREGKFLGPSVERYERYKNAVYFFNTREEALEGIERLSYHYSEKILKGTIEELSDNPTLVRSLNEGDRLFQYFEGEAYIQLNYRPDGEDLIALNALLKEPLFEIRTLSLEKASQIPHEAFEIM
jgi:hypothetical protein